MSTAATSEKPGQARKRRRRGHPAAPEPADELPDMIQALSLAIAELHEAFCIEANVSLEQEAEQGIDASKTLAEKALLLAQRFVGAAAEDAPATILAAIPCLLDLAASLPASNREQQPLKQLIQRLNDDCSFAEEYVLSHAEEDAVYDLHLLKSAVDKGVYFSDRLYSAKFKKEFGIQVAALSNKAALIGSPLSKRIEAEIALRAVTSSMLAEMPAADAKHSQTLSTFTTMGLQTAAAARTFVPQLANHVFECLSSCVAPSGPPSAGSLYQDAYTFSLELLEYTRNPHLKQLRAPAFAAALAISSVLAVIALRKASADQEALQRQKAFSVSLTQQGFIEQALRLYSATQELQIGISGSEGERPHKLPRARGADVASLSTIDLDADGSEQPRRREASLYAAPGISIDIDADMSEQPRRREMSQDDSPSINISIDIDDDMSEQPRRREMPPDASPSISVDIDDAMSEQPWRREAAVASIPPLPSNLSGLHHSTLKAALRVRGLSLEGKKADHIERLQRWQAAEQSAGVEASTPPAVEEQTAVAPADSPGAAPLADETTAVAPADPAASQPAPVGIETAAAAEDQLNSTHSKQIAALEALPISELRDACRELDLASDGRKVDLVARLVMYSDSMMTPNDGTQSASQEDGHTVVPQQLAETSPAASANQQTSPALDATAAEGAEEEHATTEPSRFHEQPPATQTTPPATKNRLAQRRLEQWSKISQMLTISELRKVCSEQGLSNKGGKADLLERLTDWAVSQQAIAESPASPATSLAHRPEQVQEAGATPASAVVAASTLAPPVTAGGNTTKEEPTGPRSPSQDATQRLRLLHKLTVPELRKTCTEQGLPRKGGKADLVERLADWALSQQPTADSPASRTTSPANRQGQAQGVAKRNETAKEAPAPPPAKGAPPPEGALATEEDLACFSITDLRSIWSAVGGSSLGSKPELVARLVAAGVRTFQVAKLLAEVQTGTTESEMTAKRKRRVESPSVDRAEQVRAPDLSEQAATVAASAVQESAVVASQADQQPGPTDGGKPQAGELSASPSPSEDMTQRGKEETMNDLCSLTLSELRIACLQEGLPSDGTKEILVQRLADFAEQIGYVHLRSLTLSELRIACLQRGLPSDGTKEILVQRLEDFAEQIGNVADDSHPRGEAAGEKNAESVPQAEESYLGDAVEGVFAGEDNIKSISQASAGHPVDDGIPESLQDLPLGSLQAGCLACGLPADGDATVLAKRLITFEEDIAIGDSKLWCKFLDLLKRLSDKRFLRQASNMVMDQAMKRKSVDVGMSMRIGMGMAVGMAMDNQGESSEVALESALQEQSTIISSWKSVASACSSRDEQYVRALAKAALPSSNDLSAPDWRRLEDGLHLNDAVLDLFIGLLVRSFGSQRVHAFGSHFFTQLTARDVEDGLEGWENVRTWTRSSRRAAPSGIFACDFLFMPIHHGKTAHWSLAIICRPWAAASAAAAPAHDGSSAVPSACRVAVAFLNSLGRDEKMEATVLHFLRGYLVREWADCTDSSISAASLDSRSYDPARILSADIDVPHQDNDSDCGVFVLEFVRHLLLHAEDLTALEREVVRKASGPQEAEQAPGISWKVPQSPRQRWRSAGAALRQVLSSRQPAGAAASDASLNQSSSTDDRNWLEFILDEVPCEAESAPP